MNITIKKNRVRFVLITVFILMISALHCQGDSNRNALREFYETKINYKQDVYNRTLKFIEENPDADGNATLYFNLAELSVEIDKEDISKTVFYYQKVLEIEPDFPNKDAVLYNIGYFSFLDVVNKRNEARYANLDKVMNWPDELRLSEEKLQTSIQSYQELAENHPNSIYHTEALYRLGTIYFEIAIDSRNPMQFYPQAITYFNRVVEKENDPLYNFGLFQRGWTHFSSGNFEQAIEDFSKIVAVLDKDEANRAFFEADAVENIAFSLIEADGTDFVQKSAAAEKAKELLRDFVSPEYARKVLLKAIDLKLTYSAPMQAIDLYNAYISLYPLDVNCPTYIDSIMTIYKQYPNRTRNNEDAKEQIVSQRIRIVNEYTPDSEWFVENKDKEISAQMNVIREAYEFVEIRYINDFSKAPTYENYLTYKQLVDNYVNFRTFKDEAALASIETMRKRIVENSLQFASLSNDPSLYFTAIRYIENYNNEYPEHENQIQFKEDIFYCKEQIYTLLKESIVESAYIDSINNVELTKDDLDTLYVSAIDNYEILLSSESYTKPNKNSELIRVAYQRADIYYNREEYDKAYENYQQLLTYQLTDPLYKTAYAILAEISEMNGDYHSSEQFYREAIKYAEAEEKKDFENNILATIRSSADTKLNTQDYQTAAEEYLRLSNELETTNVEQSVSYKMQAINVYKKAGQYDKAKDLFLQIAQNKTAINDVLAAYMGAWAIMDSLQNWEQSELLRNQFISRFPSSNEAYNLRLSIIDWYEGEPHNNKEKAAEMYLTLHEDAKNMDIGEDKREALFIKAIQLHQELGNNEKFINLTNQFASTYPNHESNQDLLRNVAIMHNNNKDVAAMLAFEKQYPNHPYSIELLKSVARIYNENKETDKFEEIARYIYKKDPSVDLLTDIALDKIKAMYDKIDIAFKDKKYAEMRANINDFKALDKKYKADGISLPLSTMYERFDYYEKYIDYYSRLDKKMQFVQDNIINASPGALIRVNDKTEWKRHLDGGAERIKNLMILCENAQKDLIALIQEGADYDLETEQRTKILYLVGKSYDYSHEVVLRQIQLFIDVSTQLNNPFMVENPIQQRTYKEQIKAFGNVKASEFKKKAAQLYLTILTQFVDETNYSDEWTDLSLARLVEWGIRAEKEYIAIFSDESWRINNEAITNYDIARGQSSLWSVPEIVPEKQTFEKAKIFQLNDFTSYLPVEYEAEIRPEAIIIDYIASGTVEITLNKMPMEREPIIVDTLTINEQSLVHYKITIGRNLAKGVNDILFTIIPDEAQTMQYFASKISGQYDIKQLEFYRSTEEHYLYSDYSWLSKKGAVSISNLNLDSSWQNASKSHFSVFKPQMFNMEDTKAIDIWHPDIDTTKVTTAYFVKEFDISGAIHEATAKFIGEKITTIWINGAKIVDNDEIVYDARLNKVDSRTLEINSLQLGKNTIVVKVTGDITYKGFIFELHYITDKSDKVGALQEEAETYTMADETDEELNEMETNELDEMPEEIVNQETPVDEPTQNETETNPLIVVPEDASMITDEPVIKTIVISSDSSWYVSNKKPEYPISKANEEWFHAEQSLIDLSAMELSAFSRDIVPITHSDEIESDKVYYIKQIDINSEFIQGNIQSASNNNAILFLNGVQIGNTERNGEMAVFQSSDLMMQNGVNFLVIEVENQEENALLVSLNIQVKE